MSCEWPKQSSEKKTKAINFKLYRTACEYVNRPNRKKENSPHRHYDNKCIDFSFHHGNMMSCGRWAPSTEWTSDCALRWLDSVWQLHAEESKHLLIILRIFNIFFGLVELLSCCHVSYARDWASEIDFCGEAEREINYAKIYFISTLLSLSTLGKMGQTEFLLFFHRSSLSHHIGTYTRENGDETQRRRRCRSSSVIAEIEFLITTQHNFARFYTKFSTFVACREFDNEFFLHFTLLFSFEFVFCIFHLKLS